MIRTMKMAALAVGVALAMPAMPLAQAKPDVALRAAMETETVKGDLKAAIEQYRKLAQGGDRAVPATALLRMADCYQKIGDAESRTIYERLVRDFADQKDAVTAARARLAALGGGARTSASAVRASRQVWSGKDVDPLGGPSPDGRYLTFTDWTTGDLAVRDLRDGVSRRLTNTGGWTVSGDFAENSVVSQDGRQVAYAWFVDKARRYELRMASATPDPANVRIVYRGDQTSWVQPHAWTADGKRILITRQTPDRASSLAFVSVADGSISEIKSLGWRSPYRAALSPDGRFVAYDAPATAQTPARDIYVLSADGTRESVVVEGPANDHSPMWSPDGTRLIFLSDRTGRDALWSVRLTGDKPAGPPEFINVELGRVLPLGLTKSGAFTYVSGGGLGNGFTADLTPDGAAVGTPTLVSERFVNTNGGGVWSKDGKSLAYYSTRGPRQSPTATVLVIRSTTTGEERDFPLTVPLMPNPGVAPRWFPDGTLLVAARNAQTSSHDYYRLDPATAKLILLHSVAMAGIPGGLPQVSPDGGSIYTVDFNPERTRHRLIRYDLATRQTTEVTSSPSPAATITAFALSPDGTQVAFQISGRNAENAWSTAVSVVPAGGGTPREVFRQAMWADGSRFGSLAWTADQKQLLFAKPDDDGSATDILQGPALLWRVPVAGGVPQKVGVSGDTLKLTGVHPDGTRIAFRTSVDAPSEVWVLENFLTR